MQYLIIYGISAVIFGVIGMAIGDLGGKKNGPLGGLLGALLGPIGILIVAVLPKQEEKAKGKKPEGMPMMPFVIGGAVLLAILGGFMVFVMAL
jgi:hypothetical protein